MQPGEEFIDYVVTELYDEDSNPVTEAPPAATALYAIGSKTLFIVQAEKGIRKRFLLYH